jgi:hypothetical protein
LSLLNCSPVDLRIRRRGCLGLGLRGAGRVPTVPHVSKEVS